jgi:hypothetical protein
MSVTNGTRSSIFGRPYRLLLEVGELRWRYVDRSPIEEIHEVRGLVNL